jgi:hypothetical protein
MPALPFVRVEHACREWVGIGARDWLVRQLRFGLQLPWTRRPPSSSRIPQYYLMKEDGRFACELLGGGALDDGRLLPPRQRRGHAFDPSAWARLSGIRYLHGFEAEISRRRVDQLIDLAPALRRGDCLFKADIRDAYYHLCLRKEDHLYLAFSVEGAVYVPACLNCGLSIAPWFFKKAMRPVVAYLRAKGHRLCSSLDDFFGAAGSTRDESPATLTATLQAGHDVRSLFLRLGLSMHPTNATLRAPAH